MIATRHIKAIREKPPLDRNCTDGESFRKTGSSCRLLLYFEHESCLDSPTTAWRPTGLVTATLVGVGAAAAAAGAATAAAAGDDDRGYFVAAKAACYGAICVGCLETLIIVFIVANAIIICVADVGYERERERDRHTSELLTEEITLCRVVALLTSSSSSSSSSLSGLSSPCPSSSVAATRRWKTVPSAEGTAATGRRAAVHRCLVTAITRCRRGRANPRLYTSVFNQRLLIRAYLVIFRACNQCNNACVNLRVLNYE